MSQEKISETTDQSIVGEPAKPKKPLARGRVIVYGKWCKECGLCIAFCPRGVLGAGEDGHTVVINPDACTACRWCELHCPDFAITVKRLDE